MDTGTKLGRYVITREIGSGGMGRVFAAHDDQLDREVALKVLLPEFCCDAERVERFKAEARAASALNHPNIITIYEIRESDGELFIVTEFVKGATLRELIDGGELTVSVTGSGRGGPNREYLLALAKALRGADHVWALAADSDGIDGSDDVAGGWIGPDTLVRAGAASLDPEDLLRRNDSAALFRTLGQEIKTGPTRTNVNDFRAILILPQK